MNALNRFCILADDFSDCFWYLVDGLFLSRFAGLSVTARSRCAILFSFFAVFSSVALPSISAPSIYLLPQYVSLAFGLAFAIVRLRCTQGRSGLGWFCAVSHTLFLIDSFQRLHHT